MASVTLNVAPTITSGTATVYPRSNWPYGTDIAGAPLGASVTTGTVGTDGSVTFSGLTDSTLYVAYQASPDRYVRFRTPTPSSGGGGGGGTASVQHNGSTVSNPNFVDATLADLTAIGAAAGLAPTAVKTSAYTAVASDFVPVDATGGSVTVTLPTAPADKTRIAVKLIAVSGTNTVSIAAGGSDVFNKASGSTTLTLSLLNQGSIVQYKASTGIWYVQSTDIPLSQLDVRYPVLVGGVVPVSKLASGTPDGTKFVRDDGTLATPAGGGGGGSTAVYNPNPTSQNLLAWSQDPATLNVSVALAVGVLKLTKVLVPVTISVTNIVTVINAAGSTLSNCFAALYDSTGSRIGVTADQSTAWQSTGLKTMALTGGPFSVTGSSSAFVWVALLCGAGTPAPSFLASSTALSTAQVNLGLTASTARAATNGTALTAAPTSFTPSALTLGNSIQPVALS